jgi:hypothetical protein
MKIKQEVEVTKPDHPVYQTGLSCFSRLDRVRVDFEDFICLGKIWSYLTQRATSY